MDFFAGGRIGGNRLGDCAEQAEGFTRFLPSIAGGGVALISFVLLALALKTLPVGTAYAVWVGIGAVGVALFGIGLLDEQITTARIAFLALIIVGMAGLKAIEA